jgi:hypothetical protein
VDAGGPFGQLSTAARAGHRLVIVPSGRRSPPLLGLDIHRSIGMARRIGVSLKSIDKFRSN